jgi:hypothetical protein
MRSSASKNLVHGCRAALAISVLAIPSFADVGAPVAFGLGTADTLRAGEPVTVHVGIQAAADIQQAQFTLRSSTEWQVIDGVSFWVGTLAKDTPVEFQFRAIPLRNNPEALAAVLSIAGYSDRVAILDPERAGGRFPEKGAANLEGDSRRAAAADEAIQAEFEPGAFIPEPMAATEPRIPGQPAEEPRSSGKRKEAKGRTATVGVVATGRFTFLDNNNIRRGVRFATVEVLNLNPFPSLGDQLCGRGVTDTNGNFTVAGSCGDAFDGPDLVARIVLNNSVIEVKPDNIFAGSYTFQSGTVNNSNGGAVNFGTITININVGAFAVHNLATRAQRFMADQGETMSKVTVLFPATAVFYVPVLASISVQQGNAFGEVADLFHEYGHHVLSTKAESPAPDYSNGNCDTPTPGHCINQPENGLISWTEGWPNFFGAVLHTAFQITDGYPNTTKYAFESSPDPVNFGFAGQEDMTEGVIAAILWDLFDGAVDEQNAAAPGRDRISLTFSAMWQPIRSFDPSSDIFHNHPTSIHEYWDGLRIFQLNSINLISEVYTEHNISKPQPDLEVTALQNPPQALAPGAQFSVTNTVRNTGDERANRSFTIRYELRPVGRGLPIALGTRTVAANLLAGSQNSATTSLQLPAAAVFGTYVLRACADSGAAVPESDESNNCRLATTTTAVR